MMKSIKILMLLMILIFASCLLNARHVEGYYVSKKGDTIHANFRVQFDLLGNINLKKIKRIIEYSSAGSKKFNRIGPGQVKLIMLKDSSFGEFFIAPLHFEKEWLFAQCLVNGNISVFKSARDNYAWLLNKYSSPTLITYYVRAKGKPLAISDITPFTNRFWIVYLGKGYAEYTFCLGWDGKTTRAYRRKGISCELKNAGPVRVAEIINDKIKSEYENTNDLPR